MRLLFASLAVLLMIVPGCSPPQTKPTHDGEEKNYIQVQSADADMNAAIAKAKATVDDFMQAFHTHKPSTKDYCVKKPFPTPDGKMEHMWIEVSEEKDGTLKGVVANEAEETNAVKMYDTVTLKLSEISDWKYQDGNKLIGGYTIRYFTDRMSPQERTAFCKEQGFEL